MCRGAARHCDLHAGSGFIGTGAKDPRRSNAGGKFDGSAHSCGAWSDGGLTVEQVGNDECNMRNAK